MPAGHLVRNDKLETLARKCIVFPANGSETCIAPMAARTVTMENDITSLTLQNRCVDTASTDYRVMAYKTSVRSPYYLLFYNLSPILPINLNVAHIIGVTPSHLKTKKRLFWRGDVVAMKVKLESERMDFSLESLDADLSELRSLEEFLRERYREGYLESLLHYDELQWNRYLAKYCGPSSLLFGPPKSYWGTNAAEKEEHFLHDLNELRCAIGRPPLPRHVYMKSYTEHVVTLYAALKSALGLRTGPPKLPPELERRIFEMCALESPEVCTVLVQVAKRVHMWIDPVLIATVFITENERLERFLAKLTNGKPVEYYAQHIKNLAISGDFLEPETINRILAICTCVERLVLSTPGVNLFESRDLRRLTIRLGPMANFYHPCFANLTHLHLWDYDDDWPTYAGWESLTSLTHLAFACPGTPEQVMQLMQTLPTIRYVAIGHYCSGEQRRYSDATIDNSPRIRKVWGVRIVCFSEIPVYDWERGARGQGDFWNLVEQEVERRLADDQIR